MIIVAAKITCPPGKRDAFIKEARACIDATRNEAGCLLYELYASTEDADKLIYYEHWKSRADLDRHIGSEHMKAFGKIKAEQDLQIGQSDIAIFDIA